MNKTYLRVLPLALCLAGSPGLSDAQGTGCVKGPDKRPPCKEVTDPQAKMVNLNLKKMTANPHCIRVYEGTTIVFSLTPKKNLELDSVEIRPKEDVNYWLQAKNDKIKDLIIVKAAGTYDPDKPLTGERTVHDYSIYLSSGECLDPRVEVQH